MTRISSICFACLFLLFVACSSTHLITPQQEWTLNRKAGMTLADGSYMTIRTARTVGDSLFVNEDESERYRRRLHFSEVEKIEWRNHSKGALRGFLATMLATAMLHVVDPVDSGFVGSFIILTAFLAPYPVGIGALIGAPERYTLEEAIKPKNAINNN